MPSEGDRDKSWTHRQLTGSPFSPLLPCGDRDSQELTLNNKNIKLVTVKETQIDQHSEQMHDGNYDTTGR